MRRPFALAGLATPSPRIVPGRPAAPAACVWRHGALLATRPLRLRGRGPVRLVHPRSGQPAPDHPGVNGRATWPLRRIELH